MRSSTGRFYEFTTPTTTAKKMFDRYQKERDTDLWHNQYERMQEELKRPREKNHMLKRGICVKSVMTGTYSLQAEFPSSVTANTVLVEMPLPAYTSRYFYPNYAKFGLDESSDLVPPHNKKFAVTYNYCLVLNVFLPYGLSCTWINISTWLHQKKGLSFECSEWPK
ncbi:uncharacterized protein [Euphorbia lathyris]|uniref:uncharacterized protein n=1 Tax=Euphorbia lathyris TaxID=212925 RepID=UPI0033134A4B